MTYQCCHFEGIADETFRDCACGESLSVSPRIDENAFGIFRGEICFLRHLIQSRFLGFARNDWI